MNNNPTTAPAVLKLRISTDLGYATLDAGTRPNGRKKRWAHTTSVPRFVTAEPLSRWAAGFMREQFPGEPDFAKIRVDLKFVK